MDDPAVRYGSGTVTYTVDQVLSMPTNEDVRYGAIIAAEPAGVERAARSIASESIKLIKSVRSLICSRRESAFTAVWSYGRASAMSSGLTSSLFPLPTATAMYCLPS